MHMADALVSPIVAGTMYACSFGAMGFSLKQVHLEDEPKTIPVMGIMGAFVFATQMINFTIPGTGSSGHLAGAMLLTAILGPYAGFLTMVGVLLIQCLLFADGGILALGCNIWNMAFYGCFVGGFVIWRSIMKNGTTKRKITIASIVGCILTLQLGAFSVTLETLASGITELPFPLFVATMQPIQLIIGLVEGLITAAILCFIFEARPELIWTGSEKENYNTINTGKMSLKSVLILFTIATIIIGGLLSQVASSNPDGLEWSIKKITGSTEVAASGIIYELAEKIQNITSLLPDYSLKGKNSSAATSFSGIVGGIIVVGVCVLGSYIFRIFRKKMKNGKNK